MQHFPLIIRISFASLILHLISTEHLLSQSTDIRFDHISVEQGLSQDIVTSIAQDRHGFLWFATEDGLNRYDGYSFKIYKHDPNDSTSLPANSVGHLYVDNSGVLWIGSPYGLVQYDENRDIFILRPELINQSVTSIYDDGKGNLWVGTDNGLNRIDRNRTHVVQYHHDPRNSGSLSADSIRAVYRDRSNILWVGTRNGLNKYDPARDQFTRYFYNERPRVQVNCLADDGRGNLWVGCSLTGIRRFSPNTGKVVAYRWQKNPPSSLGDNRVFDICVDDRGIVWLGLFLSLDRYDPTTDSFIHYRNDPDNPNSLSSNRVYKLFKDNAGVLWIGTWHGGVNRYDPFKQKFVLFRNIPNDPKSLNDNEVLSILEDGSGDTWVGTGGGGLNHYVNASKTFKHFLHNPANTNSIGSNNISAVWEDRQGNLWVGCSDGPLDRFNRERQSFVHYPFKSVKTIFEDSRGELWLGLIPEGLVRFDPAKKTAMHYRSVPSNPDSLHGLQVWCIYEDRDGDIWLGTWERDVALNRFHRKENRFSHYRFDPGDPYSISGNAVRAIYQDHEGFLWFGTWGAGLNKFDPVSGKFTRFSERDGLPNNYIKGILADDHENLWISTEKGLSKFNPRTIVFKNYTSDDGLQGNRFLSGSCFRGKSGMMYFGGDNGYNVFYPDSIRDNPYAPPVVITSFKVFDKPLQLAQSIFTTKQIDLSYSQDAFSFEFVALDYSAPHKNEYAYMMEGFDRDWILAGTRRYAAYTHLDPGAYTFRVKGSNSDGVWNEAGTSILVTIATPYWQTWWFRSLVLIVIAGVLYALYRYRVSNLLAVERLRSRIAADLHDDVGSNLSSIALGSQLIARKLSLPESERNRLEEIGTTALRTSEMMKDIVWLLNPKNDSLDELLLEMKAVAARMLGGITFTFTGPDKELREKIDLAKKRNLYLMFKEILNNVVKHAAATSVIITVRYTSGQLTLIVQDNGLGFDVSARKNGNGLNNLRSRSQQINGTLVLESAPGKGTSVSLTAQIT
jgi:ligand-binding sensor domain-containing protein/signal transduction histidine kinase